MNAAVLFLHLIAFAVLFALPRVFFKRGRLGLLWWLTGAPFGVSAISLLLAQAGRVPVLIAPASTAGGWLAIASVPFAVASIALISATLASHRVPLALWHQSTDAPQSIVTHGPYRFVRHPFYASFLLMLTGAALASPSVGTLAALVYGLTVLSWTAGREERRLLASSFGNEYASYLKRTGRFVPRPAWR